MAISLVGLQLLASLYKHGVLSNRRSVMEIGAQDLFPKQDDIARLLTSLVGFQWNADRVITSELLYKSLGFTAYQCIDADGRHNALAFDLNKDLAREYQYDQRFDLVTNFGTTEHVFDQGRVFRSIHNLCAEHGVMIHEVPFQKWFNHGFYNYQPAFFYTLASANQYEVLGTYLGLPNDLVSYSDDMANMLLASDLDIDLLVVLQRTSEHPFTSPIPEQPVNAYSCKDQLELRLTSLEVYDQFFPGVRHPRADTNADINLMTMKRIAKALARRIGRKLVGV